MNKYRRSLFLSGVILFLFAGPAFSAGLFIPGDANGDGKVDITDAVLALQISNLTNPADQTFNSDADVNYDGVIGQEEALYTLQRLAGLRPAFLYETPVIFTSDATSIMSTYALAGMVSPEVVSLGYTFNGGVEQPLEIINNTFSVALTLNVGPNTICTRAVDSTGLVADESCFTAVYDPVMVSSGPFSQTRSYNLTGMVMSEVVKSLSYSLNGGDSQPVALQSVGVYSVFPPIMEPPISLLLNAGENALCIRSADAANNQISNTCLTVVWSPVGVTSEATSPTSSYNLTGQASAEVESLTYTLNNGNSQAVAIETGGSFSVPLLLSPGANNICMTATDGAGSVLMEFCYGVAYLPVVVTSKTVVTESAYTLTGTAAPEVEFLSCSLNDGAGQEVAITSGAFGVPFTLETGENRVCVTATVPPETAGTSCFDVIYDAGLPSSFDLIAAALAAGEISAEEALIYKAYAAYGDDRLPPQYKGDDNLTDSAGLQAEIYAAAPLLSQSAKDTLGAFLVPPYYEDIPPITGQDQNRKPMDINTHCSIFEDNPTCRISEDWSTIAGNFVKVWYLTSNAATDKPVAERILALMETKERAWDRLTTLMGRLPLSDGDEFFNGGDGLLDICLVEQLSEDGVTTGLGGKKKVPVYIRINRYNDLTKILPATVHEFMHAIQFGIDIKGSAISAKEYLTLSESTANWAANFIFGNMKMPNVYSQWEHKFLGSYLGRTDEAFDYTGTGWFPYGLYLFPLYLSKTYGNPVIKRIWDVTPQHEQLRAIDAALTSYRTNLKMTWPNYAQTVWNHGSVIEIGRAHFKEWDDIQAKPFKGDKLDPPGDSLEEYDVKVNNRQEMNADLEPFSARYYHHTFTNPSVRSVLFLNGLNFKLAEVKAKTSKRAEVTTYSATRIDDWTVTKGARVQALIKIGGSWKPYEDWSAIPFKPFCRDKADERIEELVLIFSAGDLSGKPFSPLGEKPMLWATDVPCGPGKFTAGISCIKNHMDGIDTQSLNIADMNYIPAGWSAAKGDTDDAKTFYAPIERDYAFSGGTIQWNATLTTAEESISGGGSFDVDDAAEAGAGIAFNLHNIAFVRPGDGYKGYFMAGGVGNLNDPFMQNCPAGHDPSSIECGLGADFSMKPVFDMDKEVYIRRVVAADIEPSGPGTYFSDEEMSYPEAISVKGRTPLDGGEECICPGAAAGTWECSGSWSLRGTPEP